MGKGDKNFYAVLRGRTVGIFVKWMPCNESVNGFSHNNFQGFDTLEEAESYLNVNGMTDINVHTCGSSIPIDQYQDGITPASEAPISPPSATSELPTPIHIPVIINDELTPEQEEDPHETLIKMRCKPVDTVVQSVAKECINPEQHWYCPMCNGTANSNVLTCSTCQSKIHYKCSYLPTYQVSYLVSNKRRKFVCENCSDIKDDIKRIMDECIPSPSNQPLSHDPEAALHKVAFQVDINTNIARATYTDVSTDVQVDLPPSDQPSDTIISPPDFASLPVTLGRINQLEATMVNMLQGMCQDMEKAKQQQLMAELKTARTESHSLRTQLDGINKKCRALEKQSKEHISQEKCTCDLAVCVEQPAQQANGALPADQPAQRTTAALHADQPALPADQPALPADQPTLPVYQPTQPADQAAQLAQQDAKTQAPKVNNNVNIGAVPNVLISKFLISDLLCFVQCMLDGMGRDLLVKLCCEFYNTDEIARSKRLLFDSVNTRIRYSRRKGENKNRENMNDITRVFLELDFNTGVTFASSNLYNIPPLSIGNYDCLSVVRDVVNVKESLAKVLKNQLAMTDLMNDQIKTCSMDQYTPNAQCPLPVIQSTPIVKPQAKVIKNDTSIMDPKHGESLNEEEQLLSLYETRSEASIDQSVLKWSEVKQEVDDDWPGLGSPLISLDDPRHFQHSRHSIRNSRRKQRKDEHGKDSGTQRREMEPSSGIVMGKGESTGLRAVSRPWHSQQKSAGNIQVTGVFLSRLDPKTTCKDVERHVFLHIGMSVTAQKLNVKYPDSYSSFYIRGNKGVRDQLIDAKVWPRHSLVKPFEEK